MFLLNSVKNTLVRKNVLQVKVRFKILNFLKLGSSERESVCERRERESEKRFQVCNSRTDPYDYRILERVSINQGFSNLFKEHFKEHFFCILSLSLN